MPPVPVPGPGSNRGIGGDRSGEGSQLSAAMGGGLEGRRGIVDITQVDIVKGKGSGVGEIAGGDRHILGDGPDQIGCANHHHIIGAGDGDIDIAGLGVALIVGKGDGVSLGDGVARAQELDIGSGHGKVPGDDAAGSRSRPGGIGGDRSGEGSQLSAAMGGGLEGRRGIVDITQVDIVKGKGSGVGEIAGGDRHILGDGPDQIGRANHHHIIGTGDGNGHVLRYGSWLVGSTATSYTTVISNRDRKNQGQRFTDTEKINITFCYRILPVCCAFDGCGAGHQIACRIENQNRVRIRCVFGERDSHSANGSKTYLISIVLVPGDGRDPGVCGMGV